MKLTLRQKEIINIILKFDNNLPCKIQIISEQLKISTRTVLRELAIIEDWFTKNDLVLVKKAGVGIYYDNQNLSQVDLLELIDSSMAKKEYTKLERKYFIIKELICSNYPVKSSYFSSKLGISAKKLNDDLEDIAFFLNLHDITLHKKTSVGISITKNEFDIRKLIITLMYEIYGNEELLKLSMCSNNELANKIDCEFISLKNIEIAKKVLSKVNNYARFSDRAYISILFYLIITINRIDQGHCIMDLKNNIRYEYISPGFIIAKEIIVYIEDCFGIKNISKQEIIHLASYFVAFDVPILENTQPFNTFFNQVNEDVKELIELVSKETKQNFICDNMLKNDLLQHMKIAIPRIEMNINISNNEVGFLKDNYPQLFSATKKAYLIILEKYEIYQVLESEVAFIVAHFGVSVERLLQRYKIRIMVACPLCISTSKILISRLNKVFPIFEVINTISIFNIDTKALLEQNIQLIISTVKLSINFPSLKVDPMLNKEDKHKLQALSMQLAKDEVQPNESIVNKTATSISHTSIEDIKYMNDFGNEILNILNTIFLYRSSNIQSKYELIGKIASLLGNNNKEAITDISACIISREEIISTYIKEYKIYLFHSKTKSVRHTKIGMIKLSKSFVDQNNYEVFGAIAILVPEDASSIHMKISSQLSSMVADEGTMAKLIRVKTKFELSNILEKYLIEVYKEQIQERIGGV
ncbi:MAG: hypothetical protein ATN31_10070 [Candidatus Epulonipiscioides saccharophilum]|nr:MAG: hypothetical protein ATN31_10070 [Epulopiscium sp. AS2M-Bin001]